MKKNIVQWVFLIIIACLSLGIYQYPIYAQEHTQLQEEQQDNTAQKEIQPLKESQNILKEENQQINQQTNKQTNQQQDTTEVQEGSAQTENNPDVSNIEN
jgi:Na+-translocating ferredoxin:NAD+ oxidoreductase RnfG subunit